MKYGLHYRPAGLGSVPKGDYTVTDHPFFRHGVIEYPEALSDEDVKSYQLVPIVSIRDHALLLIDRMGSYKDRYRTKPEYLTQFVQTFKFDDGVYSTSDIMQLVEEIEWQLNFNAEESK